MALYGACLQLKQLSHSSGDWVIYKKKKEDASFIRVQHTMVEKTTEERGKQRGIKQISKRKDDLAQTLT